MPLSPLPIPGCRRKEAKKDGKACIKRGKLLNRFLKSLVPRQGPEHTPPMIVYLATEEAANITGQMIGTSRGRVALYNWPTEVKGLYKEGLWTPEELVKLVPRTFAQDLKTAKG